MPLRVAIKTEVLLEVTPLRLTRVWNRSGTSSRRSFMHCAGTTGYRVVTSRLWASGQREALSDDIYPSMNRIVALRRD